MKNKFKFLGIDGKSAAVNKCWSLSGKLQFFKLIAMLILISVIGFSFVACDGGKSAFVGKWYLIEGDIRYVPHEVELLKDGTGFASNQSISWKTENDRFYFIHPDTSMSFDYNILDSRLELKNDDGETFVFMNKLGGRPDVIGTWEHIIPGGSYFYPGARVATFYDAEHLIIVLNNDGTGEFHERKIKWVTDNDLLYIIGVGKFRITNDALIQFHSEDEYKKIN